MKDTLQFKGLLHRRLRWAELQHCDCCCGISLFFSASWYCTCVCLELNYRNTGVKVLSCLYSGPIDFSWRWIEFVGLIFIFMGYEMRIHWTICVTFTSLCIIYQYYPCCISCVIPHICAYLHSLCFYSVFSQRFQSISRTALIKPENKTFI